MKKSEIAEIWVEFLQTELAKAGFEQSMIEQMTAEFYNDFVNEGWYYDKLNECYSEEATQDFLLSCIEEVKDYSM